MSAEIAALALAEAQIAEGSPVGRRDAGFDRHDFGDGARFVEPQAPGPFVDRRNALGGRLEFRAHNRPRDRDRIGERLGADERRPDVEDTGGVLAIDALARAFRFEHAFIKQDRAAGAVRQDQRDCVPGAPSYRLAGQELAMGVEQDGGGLRLIDIDPDANAVIGPDAALRVRGGADSVLWGGAAFAIRSTRRCRGSRPASNTALFDILRLGGNLNALALQSRGISEPRLSRQTAILGFGQRLMRRLVAPLAAPA